MRQLELFHFKVNRTCWTGGRAQVSFLRDSEVKKLGGGDREELRAWVSQTRPGVMESQCELRRSDRDSHSEASGGGRFRRRCGGA